MRTKNISTKTRISDIAIFVVTFYPYNVGLTRTTHSRAHAHTHARSHAHTHTHTLTHARTHTISHLLSHTHTHTHTLTLAHSHTHNLTLTLTHTHTRTHTHTHSLTHTHSHTHAHTQSHFWDINDHWFYEETAKLHLLCLTSNERGMCAAANQTSAGDFSKTPAISDTHASVFSLFPTEDLFSVCLCQP